MPVHKILFWLHLSIYINKYIKLARSAAVEWIRQTSGQKRIQFQSVRIVFIIRFFSFVYFFPSLSLSAIIRFKLFWLERLTEKKQKFLATSLAIVIRSNRFNIKRNKRRPVYSTPWRLTRNVILTFYTIVTHTIEPRVLGKHWGE